MSAPEFAAPGAPQARRPRVPIWFAGGGPLVLIALALLAFLAFDGPGIGDRRGPPAEELAVEQTRLEPGIIELTVRNDGADAVRIAQVVVNDAVAQFTGADAPVGRLGTTTIRITQPWIEGEAYEVAMLTSTGGTIVHEIPVAVQTPEPDLSFFGLMALLGVYVGVIPIALGMLWLPWIRRIPATWLRGIMAGTVGLLVFLVIDAVLEGLQLGAEGSQSFGGTALVWIGLVVAYLLLTGVSSWMSGRTKTAAGAGASGTQLATMIAIGIGLHNLGEGVAIGSSYATGALALGAFLVVGFAIHNTTEGLAILGPIADARPTLPRLASLGLIAGTPAIVGAWIGAAAFNDAIGAFLFGFGAGAILQVIVQLLPSMRDSDGRLLHPAAVTGLLAGLALMFGTGLLVAG